MRACDASDKMFGKLRAIFHRHVHPLACELLRSESAINVSPLFTCANFSETTHRLEVVFVLVHNKPITLQKNTVKRLDECIARLL